MMPASQWSDAGNHEYYGRGHRTKYALQGLSDAATKFLKQGQTNTIELKETSSKQKATTSWSLFLRFDIYRRKLFTGCYIVSFLPGSQQHQRRKSSPGFAACIFDTLALHNPGSIPSPPGRISSLRTRLWQTAIPLQPVASQPQSVSCLAWWRRYHRPERFVIRLEGPEVIYTHSAFALNINSESNCNAVDQSDLSSGRHFRLDPQTMDWPGSRNPPTYVKSPARVPRWSLVPESCEQMHQQYLNKN
ncbi:unnamed protein product, partial [Protopolystoma xenopodis]